MFDLWVMMWANCIFLNDSNFFILKSLPLIALLSFLPVCIPVLSVSLLNRFFMLFSRKDKKCCVSACPFSLADFIFFFYVWLFHFLLPKSSGKKNKTSDKRAKSAPVAPPTRPPSGKPRSSRYPSSGFKQLYPYDAENKKNASHVNLASFRILNFAESSNERFKRSDWPWPVLLGGMLVLETILLLSAEAGLSNPSCIAREVPSSSLSDDKYGLSPAEEPSPPPALL